MAAKFRSMRQVYKAFILICFLFAPCLSKGQTGNHFSYSTGNSMYSDEVFIQNDRSLVIYKNPDVSLEPAGLLKFNSQGNLQGVYNRTDTWIVTVYQTDTGFVLLATDSLNWRGGMRTIILDQNLNQQRDFIPIQYNLERPYFAAPKVSLRSGKITYLVEYLGDTIGPPYSFGWRYYSANFDSLIGEPYSFQSDSIRIQSISTWNDSIYFATSDAEGVNTPGITGSLTSVLRMFDDSLRQTYRRNIFVPSSVPGYPRFGGSSSMGRLLVNQHSVYGVSRYTAVSPTTFMDQRRTFAFYQFDHQLQIKKVYHSILPVGRVVESAGVFYDYDKKHIYLFGTSATPRLLSFNDQDRTGALVIAKFDTALNLIWHTEIEIPKTYMEASNAIATVDGGMVFIANRIDSTPNPNIRNLFVVKIDSAGRHSVSVPDIEKQAKVTVYPNPVADQFNIHWSQGQYESLLLYNQSGQLAYRQPLDASTNLHSLNIGHLPAGMYFYVLEGRDGQARGKLVRGPGGW
jgi:hypothetical protein